MKTRKEILNDLLSMNGSIRKLLNDLSSFGYDSSEPLIVVTTKDIEVILTKCINNLIDISDLEEWANAIEIRDDIDFENDDLKEIIFELANPDINGAITKERLLEIVGLLQGQ